MFGSLTLRSPIQTSLPIAPKLQLCVHSCEKCQKFRETSTSSNSTWKIHLHSRRVQTKYQYCSWTNFQIATLPLLLTQNCAVENSNTCFGVFLVLFWQLWHTYLNVQLISTTGFEFLGSERKICCLFSGCKISRKKEISS